VVSPRRFLRSSLLLAIGAVAPGCSSKLSLSAVNRLAPEPGPDLLLLVSVEPADGATGVAPAESIVLVFSTALDPSTLGPQTVVVAPAAGGSPVEGQLETDPARTRLTFRPSKPLATPSVRYQISLDGGLRSVSGAGLDLSGSAVGLPSGFTTVDQVDFAPPVFGGIQTAAPVACSASAVRAGWKEAMDDATPPGAIVYRVYRRTEGATMDFSTPATTSNPGALEVLVTGLAPDTLYFLTVRAVDQALREDQNTAELSVKTLATADSVPPVFAGPESAAGATTRSILVTWQAASDNCSAQSDIRYRIYLAPDPSAPDLTQPPALEVQGATSAEVKGLDPDRLYHFAVRALDTADNLDQNQARLSARPLASFAANVLTTIRNRCGVSGCHAGSSPSASLNLTSYSGLTDPTVVRDAPVVVGGHPADSLIIWRTDERNAKFQEFQAMIPAWRMPPAPRPPLTTDFLDSLIRWIDQGAANN
jgi:hypothetical protein